MKNKKQIPRLDTEADVDHFWSKNDSTKYLDWSKAKPSFFPKLKPSVRTVLKRIPQSENEKITTVKIIGAIIPAYDVAPWIGGVLEKVIRTIPPDFVWVVDDGSADGTFRFASEFGVHVIMHPSNRGKGEALKTGFAAAMGKGVEAVFTLDGDGQHDPSCICDFIRIMNETSSDIVLGTRSFRLADMPADRIFSNRMSSMLASVLAGKWIFDSQCGYRLIRTDVLRQVTLGTGHYETETELLVKAVRKGCKVAFCPVPVLQVSGSSHIQRFRDTVRFCRLVIKLIGKRQ
jgi:glycosyltransferase involved in cell wall biosynthesis